MCILLCGRQVALKRPHGPSERVEWDPSVIWHGLEAGRRRGAQHSTSTGEALSLSDSAARLSSTFLAVSGPQSRAARSTVRNYARRRQSHGFARRGNPRTKDARRVWSGLEYNN